MSCCQSTNQSTCCATDASTDAHVRRAQVVPTFRPNADIHETPEAFIVRADVPGARPEGVDVRFEDGVLTLKASVPARKFEHARALSREYGVGDFERAFRVGEGIDTEQIKAELKDGVLTLTLPKAAAVRPRAIKVQTA